MSQDLANHKRKKSQPSEFLHQVLPDRPHARSLPVYVHRDGGQQARDLDPTDRQEDLLRAIRLQPLVEKEGEDQAVEDVLREIERDERLAGILPVAVHGERDRSRAAQRAPEADDAEEDGRNRPVVSFFGAPPEPHQADTGGYHDRDRHHESELRLVDASVVTTHEAHDDIADSSGDSCTQYPTNEWG